MQRRIGRFSSLGLFGCLILLGGLAYWQLFRTDLSDEPDNPRLFVEAASQQRGRVFDAAGNVVAFNDPANFNQRTYTTQSLAHVLGYTSVIFGQAGIENAYNEELSGHRSSSFEDAVKQEFLHEYPPGDDVYLTIDPEVQAAAAAALGQRRGAVVAINPQTGAVLAMASWPTFDANLIDENAEVLGQDPDGALLNRAAQGLYPPGSTFKAVTAAAALQEGVVEPSTPFECFEPYVIEGFEIACDNVAQGIGAYDFTHAFTFSVNAIFGEVGVALGWPELDHYAREFGFGEDPGLEIETSVSTVHAPDANLDGPLLASTAFGQGELLSTPLQMAMVAAAIANDGVLMEPYLVSEVRTREGELVRKTDPSEVRRVIDTGTADTVTDLMVSAVDNGFGQGAKIPGVRVAGKTGTAETGQGTADHAWFISFAPADNPTVAVAVIVENAGFGSTVAVPVAQQVMLAALQ
jgi:peptidoglycan glycosyltransferase